MNKIILCLVLLMAFPTKAQDIFIDSRLSKYVYQFINEGSIRGVTTAPLLIRRLDSIKIDMNMKLPTLGFYDSRERVVRIGIYNLMDTLIVKSTVYHELAHVVKYSGVHKKEPGHIMSERSPETFAIYFDSIAWRKEVDTLFNWIKNGSNNKINRPANH